ncbi:uncharacterized protein NEPG_00407 [Nematocida parisii ERTm1]|uniref:Uncharacterized protein n=1 Tax=Nematocida parisii (strain ERTm3) TaxID=935791 RepID=I3EHD4_NEMP3|nr:uncharacterized protein NEPG_00407 [Nematocida parisii ERTm1]EIJ88631.1 hypothetical protein NEQG_01321 [Nematocida parisii ERTm3]EIJ94882.1 hypothetical protein NEPG_00407 [Nematocida parisii ERTm1]KAI5145104.1 hypothetical protein NEPAR07_1473 [Nematocida parisii]KAI5157719.1 hypothetical protein NEPAR05_1526 [Nematocida parisii]|eukprot:XP_013058238.1 hypothetical protein NEPG_00407 [Nematocida parisii ERTm1]
MSVLVKNSIKAISNGSLLESTLWGIFLPLSIIVEMFILPFTLTLFSALRKARKFGRVREVIVCTNETYNSPDKAVKNLKDAFDNILARITDFIQLHILRQKPKAAKAAGKSSSEKDEKKKVVKTYKKPGKRGDYIKSWVVTICDIIEKGYEFIFEHILRHLVMMLEYAVFSVFVISIVTINVICYLAQCVLNIIKGGAKKIPIIGDLIKEIPDVSILLSNISKDVINIINPELKKEQIAIRTKQFEEYKNVVEPIGKILSSYISLCIFILSNLICIFIRAFMEFGKKISDKNNYTVFTVGILSIIAVIFTIISPKFINPQDFSIIALSKPLWFISGGICIWVSLFFVAAACIAGLHFKSSMGGKKYTKKELTNIAVYERERFGFAIAKVLIGSAVFFGLGALGNVLVGGPEAMFITIPVILFYTTIISVMYDMRSILYKITVSQIEQLKSILVLILTISVYFSTRVQRLPYLPHSLLAVTLAVVFLPTPAHKDTLLAINNKVLRTEQIIYFSIRLAIIAGILIAITPSAPTIIFRPFIYVRLVLNLIMEYFASTGRAYVFDTV